ncbi:MAG: putative metal-binding motif-containing protein, partial [Patescibacteria group bacterium]
MSTMFRILVLVCTLSAMGGCEASPLISEADLEKAKDRDEDGIPNALDCAPDDGTITTFSFWHDHDRDGVGAGEPVTGCTKTEGFADRDGDCDDENKLIHPAANEICDGADNDCNKQIDDKDAGLDPTSTFVFHTDADEDGYGNKSFPIYACVLPSKSSENALDCDDTNPKTHPSVTETCDHVDNDCNGATDEDLIKRQYLDADEDGFGDPDVFVDDCPKSGYVANNLDCDDAQPKVNPTAIEICDGVDNDCNKQIDEGLTGIWYQDQDKDAYGNPDVSVGGCPQPGYVASSFDCLDTNSKVHPDTEELCDTLDNNCDGQTDEDLTAVWYIDQDLDGFGSPSLFFDGCQKAGYVGNNLDCNDGNNKIAPNATEVCDSVDNDCNGATDEDLTVVQYQDQDKDGYGNPDIFLDGCPKSGYVANNLDCNDGNNKIAPSATEICDEVDNDCNGVTDEDLTSLWYLDQDNDGFGDSASSFTGCPKAGYVNKGLDCNTSNPQVNPNAIEVCNGIDDNCGGQTDEGLTVVQYKDQDKDGYGNPDIAIDDCKTSGYVENNLDCNDANIKVSPSATETCDGLDNDCNGQTDEGFVLIWYLDADHDLFGRV